MDVDESVLDIRDEEFPTRREFPKNEGVDYILNSKKLVRNEILAIVPADPSDSWKMLNIKRALLVRFFWEHLGLLPRCLLTRDFFSLRTRLSDTFELTEEVTDNREAWRMFGDLGLEELFGCCIFFLVFGEFRRINFDDIDNSHFDEASFARVAPLISEDRIRGPGIYFFGRIFYDYYQTVRRRSRPETLTDGLPPGALGGGHHSRKWLSSSRRQSSRNKSRRRRRQSRSRNRRRSKR